MSSTTDENAKSPLDAAQKIVAELTGMSTEHQSLSLKFAIETLGLQLLAVHSPSAATPINLLQAMPPHAATNADHSTDIRSFTTIKSPKSDQQFTAIVAYFYQFEAKPSDRHETIDAETMKEAARLAGWPQVARWNMTLTNAKNAGYLDAAGVGKYKLSSVGENLVAITLPDSDGARQGKSIGNKNSKKRAPKKSVKKSK